MLADCDLDEDYCFVKVSTDYMALGNQQARISRGCRKKSPSEKEEQCYHDENATMGTAFKDCLKMCSNQNGPCNKDLNIDELYEGEQDTCYSCYTADQLDGSVSITINVKKLTTNSPSLNKQTIKTV